MREEEDDRRSCSRRAKRRMREGEIVSLPATTTLIQTPLITKQKRRQRREREFSEASQCCSSRVRVQVAADDFDEWGQIRGNTMMLKIPTAGPLVIVSVSQGRVRETENTEQKEARDGNGKKRVTAEQEVDLCLVSEIRDDAVFIIGFFCLSPNFIARLSSHRLSHTRRLPDIMTGSRVRTTTMTTAEAGVARCVSLLVCPSHLILSASHDGPCLASGE